MAFAPFNYGQAVGQGTQNALTALQLKTAASEMQDKAAIKNAFQEAAQTGQDPSNVLAAKGYHKESNALRESAAKVALENYTLLEKSAKLVTDQPTYDAWRKAAISRKTPGAEELPGQYNPELVDHVAGRAREKIDVLSEFSEIPGLPPDVRGQRSTNTGDWRNIQTPKSPTDEPLQEIYDPKSPTGTRFVSRSQAVGQPGKPGSNTSLQVGPDGVVTFNQGRNNNELTKPALNESQEKTIGAGESLARLQRIKENYKPQFLTYQGKLSNLVSGIKSKAGAELTPEENQSLRQYRRFSQGVNFEFNAYRKLITGAAAALKEMEDLKKATINTDLSPAEFEASFNEYSRELQRTIRIRNKLIRNGIQPGSKQFGEELDGLFLSNGDDDIKQRGNELKAKGLAPQQIIDTLEQEGYL